MKRGAKLSLASLISCFLIAGCAPSVTQKHLNEQPTAAYWPEDIRPSNDQGTKVYNLPWQAYITHQPLQQLITTALNNNSDLQLALFRMEEARATYGIRRADQFPSFNLNGQGARARQPGDITGLGDSQVNSEYRAEVGLSSWEIDLWGRVRNLKEAAMREFLASAKNQQAIRASLIAEVTRAYLGLRELDERLLLTEATIRSREDSYRIFQRRNQVGSTSALELAQVEILLIQARTLGAELEQARASQRNALQLLLGTPVDFPKADQHAADVPDDAVFAQLQVGLPSELLLARPDIQAAEHQLFAAKANIRAARAAFFPKITLIGGWGSASTELDGLFEGGSRAWSFVPSISLPIFDGGRLRSQLDLATVRSNIAVTAYEKSIQVAFREVADALAARQWLTQQVELQHQALEAQTRRAHLAQLRYDSGAAAYLEVLDAQRDLLDSQQSLVQVRRNLLDSHINLYTALGGGTEPHTSPSTP